MLIYIVVNTHRELAGEFTRKFRMYSRKLGPEDNSSNYQGGDDYELKPATTFTGEWLVFDHGTNKRH